jgi:hypothetical protein
MISRDRASQLAFIGATGDQVMLLGPVPAGYHWIIKNVSAWRITAANQLYSTLYSGIFILPPGISIPGAIDFEGDGFPMNAIMVQKNMDLFFEGVAEEGNAAFTKFKARIDVLPDIVLPSQCRLAAVFAVDAGVAGQGILNALYLNEQNC